MEQRFLRNIPSISEAEQRMLRTKRAAVIGCGGLGGYAVEFLSRMGLGAITVADGDSFEESNLNRQTLALPALLGENKARAAAERIKAIDKGIALRCFEEHFTAENADAVLDGADIVIDALDNIPSRLLLEERCGEKGLWLIHGAVEGFNLQLCTVEPGSGALRRLYGGAERAGGKSVVAFVPPMCAAMQCAEALKILCGRPARFANLLLTGDMESMEFDIFPL